MWNIRASRTAVGCCQSGPYVVTTLMIALLFATLYTSRPASKVYLDPNLKRFETRKSSCVRRSTNIVCGATRGTAAVPVTVAAHAPVALGHAARLRPSDGAISALVAEYAAVICGPERFWSTPLTWKSYGSG